jgi:hypothetical protein
MFADQQIGGSPDVAIGDHSDLIARQRSSAQRFGFGSGPLVWPTLEA